MSIIQKSAYLAMSMKGKPFARIVYADSTESRWFASKEAGLEVLKTVRGNGLVTSEEEDVIRVQIYSSSLPFKHTFDDDALKRAQTRSTTLFFESGAPTEYRIFSGARTVNVNYFV